MKKLLIALLTALLASGAFAQTPFPDIPDNHWAEDAVARIADLGIVIGFPDGTFRGNEAFTRYQAALVVSRLLDVINANMEAMQAMTEADIASLRNALQELASDLAAQGVRVAALESAVAGLSDDVSALGSDVASLRNDVGAMGNAMAGLSDDVAANSARIADLEGALDEMAMMMEGMGGMDEEVLRDLQNQIAALRVNVDTALAQAEAASAQAAAAASDAAAANAAAGAAQTTANAAAAQARENAAQIAAVNSVLNLFNDRLAALEGMEPGGDTIINQVDDEAIARNASDIANIREFVILLRRDQVALRDAVNALQASDAQQAADIADLQGRVQSLEDNPLGLTGSIEFDYFVGRVDGLPFDIDRAYGLNADRDMGESVFSSGEDPELSEEDDEDIDVGEAAQDLQDIEHAPGNMDVSLEIDVRNGAVFDGYGSPNMLNSFSAVFEFGFEIIDLVDEDETIAVLTVGDTVLNADFVGMEPITVVLGDEVSTTLTDNVVNLEDLDGFTVAVGTPDFLAFANPNAWFFYLADTDEATNEGNYYRGARGTASFIDGITGGVSFAQLAENGNDKDDVLTNNIVTTVLGVDAQASIGPLDLVAEFATSSTNDVATATTTDNGTILMVEAMVDTGSIGIPILDNVWAAYLDFEDGWFDDDPTVAFGLDDEGSHEDDQVGFFVTADLDIFGLLDLSGYVDSYSLNSAANSATFAFGIDATGNLPLGFALTAFYHSASIEGTAVNDLDDGFGEETGAQNNDDNVVFAGGTERDNDRNTGFGVGLNHDGDGDNALIPNLNLEFAYEMTEADFSNTYILASADYELSISIVTLTPYVMYESEQDSDTLSDDTTTIAAGTGLETAELDIFLRPSLEAAVNYRTTDHTDAAVYTASELQYSVALHLNQFLMEHTMLTVKYGSWTGTNIEDDPNVENYTGDAANDRASDISNGDKNGTGDQSVNGYEVILNFYDAEFAYGAYVDGNNFSSQAFSISYVIDW